MPYFDCTPTMTDTQVVEFCRRGYLLFEGVVPDEINQRAVAYCDENNGAAPGHEDWYVDNVTLNPQVVGSIRSLLGKNFRYVRGGGNHRVQCPSPAQNWHRDGGSKFGPQLDCLQVFYYPQDTPVEMGPTEVLPGSQFLFSLQASMGHYGKIRGTVLTTAPAGSIFLTVYSIWHRRSASTGHGIRNLMKYWYVRTVPPERDWVREPDFDLKQTFHTPPLPGLTLGREHHRTINDAAEMIYWLCGQHDVYRRLATEHSLPIYF